MTVGELRRFKALEAENRHLKQIVAEQTLESQTLKELLSNLERSDKDGKREKEGEYGSIP